MNTQPTLVYFDAVPDSFPSSCVIKTVTEFETVMLLAMLTSDQGWEAFPGSPHRVPAKRTGAGAPP